MINITNQEDCCGCKACEQVCPKECIEMVSDSEGFWYPKVSTDKCIKCGLCEQVCPELNHLTINTPKIAYAGFNSSEDVRRKSSSGGVFTALASDVLERNGVVFGAKFDSSWNVVHDYTETLDGVSSFQGSKYVQSDIKKTYSEIKSFLATGRYVLFSGTPCQVAGLKLYLRKTYDRLISVDFICHGVPSPKVWRDYLRAVNPKVSDISSISFRDKTFGWNKFSLKIKTETQNVTEPLNENLYLKGFLQDLYLRPSCYNCSVKKFNSGSDVTLADFWGVEKELEGFSDDQGTSAVIVNSQLGLNIVNGLYLKKEEVPLRTILKYNPALIKSVEKPIKRSSFFSLYRNNDILTVLRKMTRGSFKVRIRTWVRKLLVKMRLLDVLKKTVKQ